MIFDAFFVYFVMSTLLGWISMFFECVVWECAFLGLFVLMSSACSMEGECE